MLHLDDELRLETYSQWVASDRMPEITSERDRRLLRMMLSTLTRSIVPLASGDLEEAASAVWGNDQVRADFLSLLDVMKRKCAVRGYPVIQMTEMEKAPLRIHARYTRDEILCALGCKSESVRPPSWQSGVWFDESSATDLLAFTLDKTGKSFSPSTRYRDFAISDSLIHWESQSATRAASKTGQRYIHHRERDSNILLFCRESVNERSFWFLGPADYVSHEGEQPMAITWRLRVQLPNDIFGAMAAAAA